MARLNDVQERFVDDDGAAGAGAGAGAANQVWRDLHVGLLSIDARVKVNDNVDGTGMTHLC